MNNYQMYLVACAACGANTSKTYARAHDGKCKACAAGTPAKVDASMLCPDCGVNRLTAYQKKHGYHCDACTRETDPVGYANECRGFYDGGDY